MVLELTLETVKILNQSVEKPYFKAKINNPNFLSKLGLFYGGGEGSRTPVRKSLYTTFSERSLLLDFPFIAINKQTAVKGSFINSWKAAKLKLSHVHC